jgi:hypothetical protein
MSGCQIWSPSCGRSLTRPAWAIRELRCSTGTANNEWLSASAAYIPSWAALLPYVRSSARHEMEVTSYVDRPNSYGDEDVNTSFKNTPDTDLEVLDG